VPTPERLYQGSVRALSIVFLVIGAVLLGVTIAAGGGPLSVGVLLGIAFAAIGVARLWISSRTAR
jgi:hypothetical protein